MYLYMIKATNNKKSVYYTGVTDRISRRYKEHLIGIKSKFLNIFKAHRKKLVYVEYLPPGADWRKRETQLKRYSPIRKKKLIASDKNILLSIDVRPKGMNDMFVRIILRSAIE